MTDLEQTASALSADLVMLSASDAVRFDTVRPELARLATGRVLALAGPGASAELAGAVGAEWIHDDPVSAAERLVDR
jgi:hypothetical protein